MQQRAFNTQSSLTYREVSAIIAKLEADYKEELLNINSETLSPYKVCRGKILGLRQLLNELEDYMTNRHKRQINDEFGDTDDF